MQSSRLHEGPSLHQWRDKVHSHARLNPSSSLRLPVSEAAGMRLSDALTALTPSPAFTMSAMDGFAARLGHARDALTNPSNVAALAHSSAHESHWHVSGDISAGSALIGDTTHLVRIMTGAPVPPGYDIVIPVELTDADATSPNAPAHIRISTENLERIAAFEPGKHIRSTGEELAAGTLIAPPHARLTAPLIGLALATGTTHVEVYRPPHVAIVMTGDELVSTARHSAENPIPGAVVESNGDMLAAAVRECGAHASIHHASDTESDLIGLVRSLAPRVDLILTTGGVGSGSRDVVKSAFGQRGLGHSHFAHVLMRPGGPQGVGRIPHPGGDTPMVHLPGTPVGAFVGFHLFVRPVLGGPPLGLPSPLLLPHDALSLAHPAAAKDGSTIRPVSLDVRDAHLTATEIEGPRLSPYARAHALAISTRTPGDTNARVEIIMLTPATAHEGEPHT